MMLRVDALTKSYGGVRALDGVSFEVEPGECVALIGPNGAGKSTCFACLAGQQRPGHGTVSWAGQSLDGLTPQRRLQLGVARTFQRAQTFEALTVRQSLLLLTRAQPGLPAWDLLGRSDPTLANDLLEKVGLRAQAQVEVAALSYGGRKRLELAMALAGLAAGAGAAQSQLLLLDEPVAGLGVQERVELIGLVKALARGQGTSAGMAVLYTEHNMDMVFGVADRVLVLIDGKLAAQGTADAVARDSVVRSRYLGALVQP